MGVEFAFTDAVAAVRLLRHALALSAVRAVPALFVSIPAARAGEISRLLAEAGQALPPGGIAAKQIHAAAGIGVRPQRFPFVVVGVANTRSASKRAGTVAACAAAIGRAGSSAVHRILEVSSGGTAGLPRCGRRPAVRNVTPIPAHTSASGCPPSCPLRNIDMSGLAPFG